MSSHKHIEACRNSAHPFHTRKHCFHVVSVCFDAYRPRKKGAEPNPCCEYLGSIPCGNFYTCRIVASLHHVCYIVVLQQCGSLRIGQTVFPLDSLNTSSSGLVAVSCSPHRTSHLALAMNSNLSYKASLVWSLHHTRSSLCSTPAERERLRVLPSQSCPARQRCLQHHQLQAVRLWCGVQAHWP
jgi:hypothetical protein